jgi:hypothetical protein
MFHASKKEFTHATTMASARPLCSCTASPIGITDGRVAVGGDPFGMLGPQGDADKLQ